MRIIKKVISKFQQQRKHLGRYGRYLWLYGTHTHPATNKPVAYFYLTQSGSRYPYNLVALFQKAGYRIYLHHRYSFIIGLGMYSQKLLALPALRLCLKKPSNCELFVTDDNQLYNRESNTAKILIDYDVFAPPQPNICYLSVSFMMHPTIYQNEAVYEKIDEYRSQERQMRVLFAGNAKAESYIEGKEYITSLFKKNFRPDLISYVKQRLPTEQQSNRWHEGQDRSRTFTLLPRVPGPIWLATLARSDFFFAPCGIYMPFSHNIVEAMAVGTIPITEYGELFAPPLVDGETCLMYRTKSEAVEVIRKALAMPAPDIQRLRDNVIDYYIAFLQPDRIKERLTKLACQQVVLPFNIEKKSVDLLANQHKGVF